jgi:hypothetical protein
MECMFGSILVLREILKPFDGPAVNEAGTPFASAFGSALRIVLDSTAGDLLKIVALEESEEVIK